jgi:hypothetical protein
MTHTEVLNALTVQRRDLDVRYSAERNMLDYIIQSLTAAQYDPSPESLPTAPATAAAPAAASTKLRATGSPLPAAPSLRKRGAVRDAVRRAIAALPEPFTSRDISAWLAKHEPELVLGKSTVGTTICALVGLGDIREGPEKDGYNAYKKAAGFPSATSVADKYRDFRATVPAPAQEE